ncbi:32748_t:CDS:2 [Gigaspora margarita]|uniref:32748_t:CDS:1 n=1 Tax=Gigaspora margarita TaxID=4874 RepID=A0ABN7UKD4_GIGMA|nr:32748_t:CDS:2 [Gigaspora margarita]
MGKGKLKINKLDHLQVIGWKIEKKDVVENKIVREVKKSAQCEIRVNSLVVSLLEKRSRGTKKKNEVHTGASDKHQKGFLRPFGSNGWKRYTIGSEKPDATSEEMGKRTKYRFRKKEGG